MIVTVFVIMVTISLFLISLGYFANESVYSIIGFFFLFLLSITIIAPGNLEYKIGVNATYNYGGNFTNSAHWDELHPTAYPTFTPNTDPIYLFHRWETNVYTNFDTASAHWFGVWLAIISGLGIGISLVEIKSLRKEGGE